MTEAKPLEDLTYRVIGAAMRVHDTLGPGLKEPAYQKALPLEMEAAGLSFEAERPVEESIDGTGTGACPYRRHRPRRGNPLWLPWLVVEEKAFPHLLTEEEIAQVITYLCATGLGVGLLLNFGRRRLEYKWIFPPKNVERWWERMNRYLRRPKETLSVNPLSHPLTDP